MDKANTQGVEIKGVTGDLVIGPVIPGLGLHQSCLDPIGPHQAEQEIDAPLQVFGPGAGSWIVPSPLQGKSQESCHPGLVVARSIPGSRVPGAGFERVIGITPIASLNLGQNTRTFAHGQLQYLVLAQTKGLGGTGHGPSLLSGNALVHDAIAQVGLGAEHGRMGESLHFMVFEVLPEDLHAFHQGIAAGTAVDHRIRAVVWIVSAWPEGETGAVAFALKPPNQTPGLLTSHAKQEIEVRSWVMACEGAGQQQSPGTLSGVLDPVVRADDRSLGIAT